MVGARGAVDPDRVQWCVHRHADSLLHWGPAHLAVSSNVKNPRDYPEHRRGRQRGDGLEYQHHDGGVRPAWRAYFCRGYPLVFVEMCARTGTRDLRTRRDEDEDEVRLGWQGGGLSLDASPTMEPFAVCQSERARVCGMTWLSGMRADGRFVSVREWLCRRKDCSMAFPLRMARP